MTAERTRNKWQPGIKVWLLMAVALLMVWGGFPLPFVEFLRGLVWAVALTLLVCQRNLITGVCTWLVAGLLLWRVTGEVSLVPAFLANGGLGLLYGHLFKTGVAPRKALGVGITFAIFAFLLIFFLASPSVAVVWHEWQAGLQASQGSVLDLYRQSGVLDLLARQGVSQETLSLYMNEVTGLLAGLLPSIMLLDIVLTAVLTYLAAYWVLRRFGIQVVALPPFREWQLPWYLIWGVICGLAFSLLGDYLKVKVLAVIGQNLVFGYLPWLVVTGLALIAYFDYFFSMALIFKLIFAVIVILNFPLMFTLVALLGAFDPLVNFRRFINRTPKGG